MRRWAITATVAVVLAVAVLAVSGSWPFDGADGPPPTRQHARAGTATLQVTGQPLQRIDGWGATIVTDSPRDPQAEPAGLSRGELGALDRLVFKRAGINLLRINGPGFVTPAGPDGVGLASDGEGRPSARDGRWALMRRARRFGVRFLFTASNAPASMKRGRFLAHGSERRFARYVADNLSFARRLGVPFDFVAIGNEIDNSARFIALRLSAGQAAKVYDALAGEITRRRLPTRLALGDNINWSGAVGYASAALRSPRVGSLASVLASHAYGGDGSRAAAGHLARARGLSLWMTEWTGARCIDGGCGDDPDIGYALRWAEQITRDLSMPGTNAWFLLRPVDDSTHGASSGIIVRTRGDARRPFYRTTRFYVFRQFTSAAPPGARRVETLGHVPALAFRFGRRLSVVVTNRGDRGRRVRLRLGPGPGRVAIRRTGATERFERLPDRRYDGRELRLSLPARSVTTVTLTRPRR